ncbi:MAG: NfeD family protein [bacterium]
MDTIKEWLKPEFIWIAVGLIFLLLEFAHPGIIVIFFGIGAWLVAITCFFVDISLNMQLLIFLFSSVIALIALRGKFKNLFQQHGYLEAGETEIINEFVGQKAVVVQEITPKSKGRVEFHGSHWDAEADEAIPAGTTVEIVDKDNITFIVKPL